MAEIPADLYFFYRLYIGRRNLKKRWSGNSQSFGIDKIIIVLFVGLTEEMVFRGWLLNVTICENRKWFYIIINAAMFLTIHFPIWIYSGNFIGYFTSLQFIEVMVLSAIFSTTFIKSRSIFVPIILHMYYDLLVFMFI
ncbi:MAG: CPBP family intramembrane metalloprotease [Lachnospiraceae bacterium]|nr:CPBP family intramembrane metalloprotease [Lachnospiraceae bacterium]